jgi:hypothetical protein
MTMNLRKSGLTIGAALFAATLLVFAVTPAHAVSQGLKLNIPFDFYAGDQQMPAGAYVIRTNANGLVQITNIDRHASAVLITYNVTNSRRANTARVIFNQYGSETFLSEMWLTGQNEGLKPTLTNRERELAAVSTPVRVAIAR